MNIIKTENLQTYFPISGGIFGKTINYVKAVDGVSINVKKGQISAIVGESGCGKSTLGLSILGLEKPSSGNIYLNGNKIDIKKQLSWQKYRKDFQIIFQDPFSSLNPKNTIFKILSEGVLLHNVCSKKNIKDYIASLLKRVGLSPDYMQRFPHAFSGGQRQRIAIARAIAIKPKMIICDEIVSALDVSVQAQIIELLLKLKNEMDLSLLFIAHDLSLVKTISDYVYVMYLGKIVEEGLTKNLFKNPKHPYTNALLNAIPVLDTSKKPQVLLGDVPSPVNIPVGCAFASRCSKVKENCKKQFPKPIEVDSGRVSCHYPL